MKRFVAAAGLMMAGVCAGAPSPAHADPWGSFGALLVRAICSPPRMVSYVDRDTGQTMFVMYGWCGVPL